MARSFFGAAIAAATVAAAISLMLGNANASTFTIIYSFQGGSDGAQPQGPLINIAGTLYGTTAEGGSGCGCGTIFSLTPAGTENVLYSFKNNGDGAYPNGLVNAHKAMFGVSQDIPSGSLYIFSVTPTGKFKVLANSLNYVWPSTRHPLTRIGGTWYGVNTGTSYTNCGNNACGYIFALQP